MGQHWYLVNLDKKEFVNPHALGCGLKLWEQIANSPGTGTAMVILCASQPKMRGGGDLDLENSHGPEVIGRWAGDRVALVGDYAEDGDLPVEFEASKIYGRCKSSKHPDECTENDPSKVYRDITEFVARAIEHELGGKYVGDGWRRFIHGGEAT